MFHELRHTAPSIRASGTTSKRSHLGTQLGRYKRIGTILTLAVFPIFYTGCGSSGEPLMPSSTTGSTTSSTASTDTSSTASPLGNLNNSGASTTSTASTSNSSGYSSTSATSPTAAGTFSNGSTSSNTTALQAGANSLDTLNNALQYVLAHPPDPSADQTTVAQDFSSAAAFLTQAFANTLMYQEQASQALGINTQGTGSAASAYNAMGAAFNASPWEQ